MISQIIHYRFSNLLQVGKIPISVSRLFCCILILGFLAGCSSDNPDNKADENPTQTSKPDEERTDTLGTSITLDGGLNFTDITDSTTFQWTVEAPAGSTIPALENATSISVTFTPTDEGIYKLVLTVMDGDSVVDTISYEVTIEGAGNILPIANAGGNLSINVGTEVTLSGSGSSDDDGTISTYTWTLTDQPTGSSITIADASLVDISFTPQVVGQYIFTLSVSDGTDNSLLAASVIINATVPSMGNSRPVAVINASQTTIDTGIAVMLDANNSTDSDGAISSYTWALTDEPTGSSITIADNSLENIAFTPVIAGQYTFTLSVNDGTDDSPIVSIIITATTPSAENSPPVAVINASQTTVDTGIAVMLNANNSTDSDGVVSGYTWTLTGEPTGSSITIADNSLASIAFTPVVVGQYTFTLSVNDGTDDSPTVSIIIMATTPSTGNNPPVAVINASQTTVDTGIAVMLNANNSTDSDGTISSYTWALTDEPTDSSITIADNSLVSIAFTPVVAGEYRFTLSVNDGTDDSPIVSIIITATTPSTGNNPPVAVINASQTSVNTGTLVRLDADNSTDSDGTVSGYTWTLTDQPDNSSITIADNSLATITFTPQVAGQYTFTLFVNDGTDDSPTVTINITVANAGNSPPIALISTNQTSVNTGTIVTLIGSGSTDSDGAISGYTWALTGQPDDSSLTIADTSLTNIEFTPQVAGQYTFTLSVNDGTDESLSADSIIITATTPNAGNEPPIANAGVDQFAETNTSVTLDGRSSSDPEDGNLTYVWILTNQPTGSTTEIPATDRILDTFSFTPTEPGNYAFSLSVNDGTDESGLDYVLITVTVPAVIADAGPAQFTTASKPVMLDGSNSYNPDASSELSYAWSVVNSPIGSSFTFSDVSVEKPTFGADTQGFYAIMLFISNGSATATAITSVTITGPSEGAIDTPTLLSYTPPTLFTYEGFAEKASSYYQINGLDDSVYHHIYLTNLENGVDLIVYDNASFTNPICESRNSLVRNENCIGKAMGGSLYIEIDGSNSENGSSEYLLNIVPATDEGIYNPPESEPVNIQLNTLHTGTTRNLYSYYRIPVLMSKDYVVSLKDMTDNLWLEVYLTDGFFSPKCSSTSNNLSNVLCSIYSSTSSALYIRVRHNTGGNVLEDIGKSFQLIVDKRALILSEGDVESPIAIPFSGSFSEYYGKVDTNISYYELTDLTVGENYSIWLTPISANIYLEITDENDAVVSAANFPKQYTFTATSPTLSIKVKGDETNFGSEFTMSIAVSTTEAVAEGSDSNPVALTYDVASGGLYYEGSVDKTDSYYAVSDLPTGEKLIFSLKGLSNDADLFIYSDAGYTNLVCESIKFETNPESCSYTPLADEGTLYIRTNGAKSWNGALYNLAVVPSIYNAQGSSETPLEINISDVTEGYSATVDTTNSYYRINGLMAGTSYEVRLANPSGDVDLYVYTINDFSSTPGCESVEWNDTFVENCIATASDTFLLVRVNAIWSDGGATFNITLTPQP